MDAFDSVKTILLDMGVPAAKVRPGASLVLDCELDSLELVNFVQKLEETCQVQISDESMSGGMTIGDVVDLIRRLRGEN